MFPPSPHPVASSNVDAGIFERVLYNERGGWHEYRLTEAGKELYDVVLAIMYWSDRHLAGPDGPPLLLRHTTCDHDTHGVVVCAHCGEPLHPHEVDPRPDPGATEQPVRTAAEADSAILT